MIPLLLWRCPLCATNDALRHVERFLARDRVYCTRCQAEWCMRRVPGDNFYLKLIVPSDSASLRNVELFQPGTERSVTAWYDAMKETIRLEATHDPALPLSPGETLYLASGPATLEVEETDPLFFPRATPQESFASGAIVTPRGQGLEQKRVPNRIDKRYVRGRNVGGGRLFLTNRRLVWQGDGSIGSFALDRLSSVYAVLDFGLMLLVEMRLYIISFEGESVLKWLTHVGLIAWQIEAQTGHRIETSHF